MKTLTIKILLLLVSTNCWMVLRAFPSEADPHAGVESVSWNYSVPSNDGNRLWEDAAWSAMAVGLSGDKMAVIGGSSFTTPDSMPGRKADLRYLNLGKKGDWQQLTDFLPEGFLPGVTIGVNDGFVCFSNEASGKTRVIRIRENRGETPFVSAELPPVADGLSRLTATAAGNMLYLFGIENGAAAGYQLDLQNPNKSWQKIEGAPAVRWEEAVSTLQSDGFDPCIYVFYDADGKTSAFNYNPRLNRWTEMNLPANFPAIAGSSAVPISTNHILLAGGENPSLRLFHTLTRTVIVKEAGALPVSVGMCLLKRGDQVYGFDTEYTPGRAPQVMTLDFTKAKTGFAWLDILVIILYFASLAWIGFYFSKRQKSADDYFKGGGRIPWWAAGLSLFGTALSAITFMAIPAKAYATDWSYMLFNTGIVLVAPIIMFLFIPFYRKLNITTAYQYLEARFNSTIRVICSLAFIIFQVGRMGVVLFLPAIALNVVTGIDIFLCIALMGVFSIIYTMVGGIEAVVWTDALQVVILIGGAIFAIFFMIGEIPGGFSETISVAAANGKFSLGDTAFNLKDSSMWTVLIAACFTHLTTYGTDQSMVQRYLTTSTQKEAQKSVLTNALLTIPATLIFFFIGTALFVFYTTYPQELSVSITSNDAIFPSYIFSNLPAGVSGLLISGVFAAAMSTLSGSMNSAATAYVVDIRSKFLRKPGKRSELQVAKRTTLVIGLLSLCFAFLMATWNINSLWDEFNKILGLILGSMGGLFILGMVTKRANAPGAMIGIIASIIVQLLVARFQVFHLLLYTASGFISCFVVGYFASFFFPRKTNL